MIYLVRIDELKQDWHPADIAAALKKRNQTFIGLSKAHGYATNAAHGVLYRAWPKMERIVADAIGVSPKKIWPSRYQARKKKRQGKANGRKRK